MKILIHSIRYPPDIGGLENIMAGLAAEWTRAGHEVVVCTNSKGSANGYLYKIIRQYSLSSLREALKNSDVFVEANVSLKTFWLGLLNKKKWFVIHHAQYRLTWDWKDFVKSIIAIFPKNISVSEFVARSLFGSSFVIPNFFNGIFRRMVSIEKDKQLVFVGRLVSDKGVKDMMEALGILANKGIFISCTVIGDGQEKAVLEKDVFERGLAKQVVFKGSLEGEALVEEVNRHQVMVVPSRWEEPFGIVALEGLACGCKMICSSGGGLREASGGFAFYFSNGNPLELANAIEESLRKVFSEDELNKISAHLNKHTSTVIAKRYLDYFTQASSRETHVL
jgi:glycogen synthase